MRNRNIFIRKETAFSCEHNRHPVFAHVRGYHDGNVHYSVDYPESAGRGKWQWHYADNNNESGTYIKPLEEFLERFSPDVFDEFSGYLAA